MTTFRTKDGHTVGLGDTVWAVNGNGPYTLTEHEQRGWVWLEGDDERAPHTAEDITRYYRRDR